MGCKKPSCCNLADRIGCLPESTRTCVLVFDAIIMTGALVCGIVAVAGLSDNSNVLQSVPWAILSPGDNWENSIYGGDDAGTIYYNLWGAMIKGQSDTASCTATYYWRGAYYTFNACKGASWDDLDDSRPDLLDGSNSTYFKDCKDSAVGCRSTAIIGVLTSVLALLARFCCNSRFALDKDQGRKCIILITTILPVITSIGGIANFQANCIAGINDAVDSVPAGTTLPGTSIPLPFDGADATPGPGLQAIIAGLVLNGVSFVLQLLLPGKKSGAADKVITAPGVELATSGDVA